jgi:uncharacterized protein (TIGR02266 family)
MQYSGKFSSRRKRKVRRLEPGGVIAGGRQALNPQPLDLAAVAETILKLEEEGKMAHERRVNRRVPAEFEVNYVHNSDYLISRSKDLSVDGMFIYTEKPPRVGETVNLTFSMGNLKNVPVQGRVAWTNTGESKIDSGMGVQFIDLPYALKMAILKILRKVAVDGDKSVFPDPA